MRRRTFEEMITYFNQTVSEMDIDRKYKMTLVGIVTALLQKHDEDVAQIVRCKDCKHWRRQTNYQGSPLSFGFCESDDMWRSLYGETCEVEHIDMDDDHYCGYAERRTDGV